MADTYNHKIKLVDTETNIISTLSIKNKDGSRLALREPSGLCVDADRNRLLVADTNNHSIHIIDLATFTAEPFLLDFNQISNTTETDAPRSPSEVSGLELVKKIPVLHHKNCNINFNMRLSSNLKFTLDAPQKWKVKFLNPALEIKQSNGLLAEGKCSLQLNKSSRTVRTEATNQFDLAIEFALSLCDSKSCLIRKFTVSIVSERSAEDSSLHPTIIKDNTLDVDVGIHINQSNINFC